ncbi:MAG TPA: hypothetical protein VOA64_08825 [Candidatus Dormibacteraeota bacterium]|nr:hypothetical protein [Candidatus Dormibacteraeota bacterium]
MKHQLSRTRASRRQRGYALMMLIFFTAIILIMTMSAAPSILTQGKREKEEEMIWRGKQYVRGVKLYYRKMGKFPTSLDDLTMPKTGSVRFMRQAYKDPMNKGDGSWRLIYIAPSGQLIGSLKPSQRLQFPTTGGLGTPASAMAGALNTPPGGLGSLPQGLSGGTPNLASQPQAGGAPASSSQNPDSTTPGTGESVPNPQSPDPSAAPTIIGGNIIGVGSKIKTPSLVIYEKAKNYLLFEFVWDPSKEAGMGQPGMPTGTGLGQNPAAQNPAQKPTQNPSIQPATTPAGPLAQPGADQPPLSPDQPPPQE